MRRADRIRKKHFLVSTIPAILSRGLAREDDLMPKVSQAPPHVLPQEVEVGRLLFDVENPRLTSGNRQHGELDVLTTLWREMAVDEVADSIAANGFFREEPLIGIPEKPEAPDSPNSRYFVVEGNRRLAAVRLLLDEKLRQRVGASTIPNLSDAVRRQIETLPVAVYPKREMLWAFLGFRHINGPKPWDSLSKAQYVARIYEGKLGLTLDQIASQIGDRHATVKRLYRGYTLLRQAETQAGFEQEDAESSRFYFSHLYTAADQTEFQKFLGISDVSSLKKNPVPRSKLQQLGLLLMWLYGSRQKGRPPLVQAQYPDLNILRYVISRKEGVDALKAGLDLERAHQVALGDSERFREAMVRAKDDLVLASGTVLLGFKGESDLMTMGEQTVQLSTDILDTMRRKTSAKQSK